jgi:hypothetical protein
MVALPGTSLAAAQPDPSDDPCGLGTAVVIAGRPLRLSGTLTNPQELVAISARNAEGAFREGDVVMTGTSWRASLTFHAGDAGAWIVDLAVDGRDCTTTLGVVLPDGATAPPHETPAAEELLVTRPPAITADGIRAAAVLVAVAAVIGSWLFLGGVAAARVLGLRPLARRGLIVPARAAAFVAVLGGFAAAYTFVWFGISMSHFDTGIPPGEEALFRIGLVVVLVIGSVAGATAARRLSPDLASRPA